MADLDPRNMLLSLRKEMKIIKAEEISLKQQILSLNDQFKVLMTSVSNLYLDLEQDTKESEIISDKSGQVWLSPNDNIRKERKSRWNEYIEDRPRRSFDANSFKSPEQSNDQSYAKSPPSVSPLANTEPKTEVNLRTPSAEYGKMFALDSDRRRRIAKRLKESRKTLDIVPLGLF